MASTSTANVTLSQIVYVILMILLQPNFVGSPSLRQDSPDLVESNSLEYRQLPILLVWTTELKNVANIREVVCSLPTSDKRVHALALYDLHDKNTSVTVNINTMACSVNGKIWGNCNVSGDDTHTVLTAELRDLKPGHTRTFECNATIFIRELIHTAQKVEVALPDNERADNGLFTIPGWAFILIVVVMLPGNIMMCVKYWRDKECNRRKPTNPEPNQGLLEESKPGQSSAVQMSSTSSGESGCGSDRELIPGSKGR